MTAYAVLHGYVQQEVTGIQINGKVYSAAAIERAFAALASQHAVEGESDPVTWQWRALEDGEPKTAWKDPDLGDRPGWEAIAKKHPDRFIIEKRALFARPAAADAGVREALTPGADEAFTALDLADRLIERGYGNETPKEWHKAYRAVAKARSLAAKREQPR